MIGFTWSFFTANKWVTSLTAKSTGGAKGASIRTDYTAMSRFGQQSTRCLGTVDGDTGPCSVRLARPLLRSGKIETSITFEITSFTKDLSRTIFFTMFRGIEDVTFNLDADGHFSGPWTVSGTNRTSWTFYSVTFFTDESTDRLWIGITTPSSGEKSLFEKSLFLKITFFENHFFCYPGPDVDYYQNIWHFHVLEEEVGHTKSPHKWALRQDSIFSLRNIP